MLATVLCSLGPSHIARLGIGVLQVYLETGVASLMKEKTGHLSPT